MQFQRDIPKTEHEFEIPDVAEFPDVATEERYQDNDKMDVLVKQLEDLFKRRKTKTELQVAFEKIIEFSKEQMPVWEGEQDYIRAYRKNALKIYDWYRVHENDKINSSFKLNKASEKVYNGIKQNGVKFFQFDSDAVKEIKLLLEPTVEKMLAKPDWTPPIGTYDRSVQMYGHKYDFRVRDILDSQMHKMGIHAACDYYWQARGSSVKKATLHVSKPTDQHLFQYYQDCATKPVTTNLHIDPKDGLWKALLYLFPVEEINGPIWFVKESHRWQRDEFEMLMARGIATGDYLENPVARRAVFRLPKRLRKSLQFGRNLLDGTAMQQKILDKKTPMISPNNLAVFDPGNIMHTGGWVTEGFRANLQIQIRPPNFS